jgi:tripartite-type tricarboxylate transporter receptor subunit TctC
MIPGLKYDPTKDLQPIATLSRTGLIMTFGSNLKSKSAREFVDIAKREPGKYACASATTTQRMGCEMFQARAGIKLLIVPYKTTASALTALSAGEADVNFADAGAAASQWQGGRAHPAAVTLPERMPLLASVPTMDEEGVKNFSMSAWYAVYAPEKTPSGVASTMREIVLKATKSKSFAEARDRMAMDSFDLTPNEVNSLIRREIELWRKVVLEQHIKVGE